MTKTSSTKPSTTATVGAIKKIAVAAALGLAALGMASGIASAAPGDNSGSHTSASSEHAGHAPRTGDSVVHAHLLPGFPKPVAGSGGDDSVVHAHLLPGFPKPVAGSGGDDSVVHAHLLPGFPKPVPSTTSRPGLGDPYQNVPGGYPGPPDNPTCSFSCQEVIDE